jgi:thioredoxin 1
MTRRPGRALWLRSPRRPAVALRNAGEVNPVDPGKAIDDRRFDAMATKTLTAANFDEVTRGDGIVLVDFWAAWCGPCRAFAPVYEKASGRHGDIVFGKVDTEAELELATQFDIRSIPTIMVVRDGVIVFEQAGALPEQALESLITQVRALDMDDVRRQVATQTA